MPTYDQSVVMLALLASTADGTLTPAEEQIFTKQLQPVLSRMPPTEREQTMKLLGQLLQSVGLENTLMSLRSALPTPMDRQRAVELAVRITKADGTRHSQEDKHLLHLAQVMGVSQSQVTTWLASE